LPAQLSPTPVSACVGLNCAGLFNRLLNHRLKQRIGYKEKDDVNVAKLERAGQSCQRSQLRVDGYASQRPWHH
jgi:hypothetical protein